MYLLRLDCNRSGLDSGIVFFYYEKWKDNCKWKCEVFEKSTRCTDFFSRNCHSILNKSQQTRPVASAGHIIVYVSVHQLFPSDGKMEFQSVRVGECASVSGSNRNVLGLGYGVHDSELV